MQQGTARHGYLSGFTTRLSWRAKCPELGSNCVLYCTVWYVDESALGGCDNPYSTILPVYHEGKDLDASRTQQSHVTAADTPLNVTVLHLIQPSNAL